MWRRRRCRRRQVVLVLVLVFVVVLVEDATNVGVSVGCDGGGVVFGGECSGAAKIQHGRNGGVQRMLVAEVTPGGVFRLTMLLDVRAHPERQRRLRRRRRRRRRRCLGQRHRHRHRRVDHLRTITSAARWILFLLPASKAISISFKSFNPLQEAFTRFSLIHLNCNAYPIKCYSIILLQMIKPSNKVVMDEMGSIEQSQMLIASINI